MKKEFPGSLTEVRTKFKHSSCCTRTISVHPTGCLLHPHLRSSPRSWGEWDLGVCREAACNIPEFVNMLRTFQAQEPLVLLSPGPAFPARCLHWNHRAHKSQSGKTAPRKASTGNCPVLGQTGTRSSCSSEGVTFLHSDLCQIMICYKLLTFWRIVPLFPDFSQIYPKLKILEFAPLSLCCRISISSRRFSSVSPSLPANYKASPSNKMNTS